MNELDGLTLPELIDQLHDIAVPAPVSYAPETAGWVVVGAILAAGIAAVAVLIYRRRRKNQYRRAALGELASIEDRLREIADPQGGLTELAGLVRRTALAVFPRAEVAHLHGDDWKAFLNRTASGDLGPGLEGLVMGPYRPAVATETDSTVRAARRWIEDHRV